MLGRGKTKIRAPRRGIVGKDDSVDFEATWDTLSSALREIHTKNASKLSFEQLYRNAYKLVLKKKGEDLYNRVKSLEEDWLGTEIQARIHNLLVPSLLVGPPGGQPASGTNERRVAGERFLKGLKETWKDHELCMSMITDVMMYMDRVYSNDHHRPSIYNTAMSLFRDYVLKSPVHGDASVTVADVLNSVMLDLIKMERAGEVINRSTLQSCCLMLQTLNETDSPEDHLSLYEQYFEKLFLATSRDFYFQEGQENLRTMDAGSFAKNAWRRLEEEDDRCGTTIMLSTSPKIAAVVDEELIRKHIKEVIELEGSGVKSMLDNHRIEDLKIIYALNSRVDPEQKKELSRALQKRLEELGREINASALNFKFPDNQESSKPGVRQPERPTNQQTAAAISWVEDVLKLKRHYDGIWADAFSSDQGLESAITKSFAEFINTNDRCQEYLSLFFDENLKKGIKGKSEAEVDALLENGIILLRFIRDKDLFETYYKKHLSRRLITKRSISMDAERQMISKMKIEAGSAFTSRLEQMFKDIAISEDLTAGFKEYVANLGDRDPSRVELEVNILTMTMWPMENMGHTGPDGAVNPACRYPPAVARVRQGFEKFYHNKHNGRQLTWLPNLGTATIRANFSKTKQARRELECSTYCMVILLLFNDLAEGASLTFEEIQAQTNISTPDLVRSLASVSLNPKTKILIKEPMSKEVNATDKFYFNEAFDSKFVKIKIGMVAGAANKLEGVRERHETEKKQEDERKLLMEARIVRIMKTYAADNSKPVSHIQLVSEVIAQLAGRFTPDVHMIKGRIEALIERDYMERVDEQVSTIPMYRYVA